MVTKNEIINNPSLLSQLDHSFQNIDLMRDIAKYSFAKINKQVVTACVPSLRFDLLKYMIDYQKDTNNKDFWSFFDEKTCKEYSNYTY